MRKKIIGMIQAVRSYYPASERACPGGERRASLKGPRMEKTSQASEAECTAWPPVRPAGLAWSWRWFLAPSLPFFPEELALRCTSLKNDGSKTTRLLNLIYLGSYLWIRVCLPWKGDLDGDGSAGYIKDNWISESIKDCCLTSCGMTFYYRGPLGSRVRCLLFPSSLSLLPFKN